MTYTLDWRERALDHLAGFLADDTAGVRAVFAAADQLTSHPEPPAAHRLGTSPRFRLRVGHYRLVYEIDQHTRTIMIMHVGRTTT